MQAYYATTRFHSSWKLIAIHGSLLYPCVQQEGQAELLGNDSTL